MKVINKNNKKNRKKLTYSTVKYMDKRDLNKEQISKTREIIADITCLIDLNYLPSIVISRFCSWNSNKIRNLIPKKYDEIIIVNNEFYFFNLIEAIFRVHSLIDYQSFMSDQGRAIQDLGAAIAFSNKISEENNIPVSSIIPCDVFELLDGKVDRYYGLPFYKEHLQQAIVDAEEHKLGVKWKY